MKHTWLERSAACFGGKELNKRWGNSDCLVELELHELFSAGTVDVHEVLVLLVDFVSFRIKEGHVPVGDQTFGS